MDKPGTAAGYPLEWVEHSRSACLYIATILGDLLIEDLIVVGGLVPGMLIVQDPPPEGVPLHPGTMDLDLGLNLAILDGARYSEISKRLRQAGFVAHENAAGNVLLQTWSIQGSEGQSATVDFLIPPSAEENQRSRIKHREKDFGAVVTPGLELAFRDREIVSMEGVTIMGERAARDIPVCGPGAFVVLKALAFRSRGEPKDAYDLYYTVRNFGGGSDEVAARLATLRPDPNAEAALDILREDFSAPDLLGPIRAAAFNGDETDDVLRQDVVGFVRALLGEVDRIGR